MYINEFGFFALRFMEVGAPILTACAAIASIIFAARQGKIRLGSASIEFDRGAVDQAFHNNEGSSLEYGAQQFALLKEYHAQGLAQSKASFWFSLIFASIGFLIIASAVSIALQASDKDASWFSTIGKPTITLVSGTVIDAVAALFFIQSNNARKLMADFFDKLRIDRKLDESLRLVNAVSDFELSSRLKVYLALHFADANDKAIFTDIITLDRKIDERRRTEHERAPHGNSASDRDIDGSNTQAKAVNLA